METALITILIDRGLYDEALSRLLEMPQNSTVLNLEGFCHLESKRYALARACFTTAYSKAIEEKLNRKTLSKISNNIGATYYREGNYEKAIDYFTLALKHDPENARAEYNLAGAYFKLKKYEKSLEILLKTYKMNPREVEERLSEEDAKLALKAIVENCRDEKTVSTAKKVLAMLKKVDSTTRKTPPGRGSQKRFRKVEKEVIKQ